MGVKINFDLLDKGTKNNTVLQHVLGGIGGGTAGALLNPSDDLGSKVLTTTLGAAAGVGIPYGIYKYRVNATEKALDALRLKGDKRFEEVAKELGKKGITSDNLKSILKDMGYNVKTKEEYANILAKAKPEFWSDLEKQLDKLDDITTIQTSAAYEDFINAVAEKMPKLKYRDIEKMVK